LKDIAARLVLNGKVSANDQCVFTILY